MYFQIYQKIKSNELKFNNNHYNLNYYWRFIISPLNLILAPLLVLLKISANFCSFLVLITGLFASYIILNTPDKTLIAIFFFCFIRYFRLFRRCISKVQQYQL